MNKTSFLINFSLASLDQPSSQAVPSSASSSSFEDEDIDDNSYQKQLKMQE
jgi:hypothetical protein